MNINNNTLLKTSEAEFKAFLKSRLSMSFGLRIFTTLINTLELKIENTNDFYFISPCEDTTNKIKTIHLEKFKRIVKTASLDFLLINPNIISVITKDLKNTVESPKNNVVSIDFNKHKHNNTSNNPDIITNSTLNEKSSTGGYTKASLEISKSQYSFDNFIVVKQNSIPFSITKDFCNMILSNNQSSNIINSQKLLFIHGSVGNGKTHLLQSSADFLAKNGKTITYLTADRFVFNYVRSLQENSLVKFKEQIFSSDVLLIDDIHFIAGKKSSIEELFNLITNLLSEGKAVILSSIYSVNSINFNHFKKDDEDINTRFRSILHSGILSHIPNPSAELRRKIIIQKMIDNGLATKEEIVNFLSSNITSNVRDIESAIRKIKINSQYTSKEIDIEFVKNILDDFLSCFKKIIQPQDILQVVANNFNISVDEILVANKIKDLTIPRQIAMSLMKEFTTLSYQEISSIFGKKTHTTIMNAVSSFEKLKINPSIAKIIIKISSELKDSQYLS